MSGEIYVGTKFETIHLGKGAPKDPRVNELLQWCHRFHELGLSPSYGAGSAGNLSFRTPLGFVITRTASFFEQTTTDDFVEVVRVDAAHKRVEVIGDFEPSSETQMHDVLYACRPDVQAVLHAHSETILSNAERLGVPITVREVPYGTPELGEQAAGMAAKADFIVLRNHGFVSLGRTIEEAGQRVLEILDRSKR